jgi:hypothetical protein
MAIPAAVGAASGARSRALVARTRRRGVVTGAGLLGLAGLLRWQFVRWFTTEPRYRRERRIAGLEVRTYPPRVEARTHMMTGDFDRSLMDGFKRLASYIFGDNRARGELAGARVRDGHRSKLAMTTPVTVSSERGEHVVAFTMPPGRALASLPEPTDDRIELVEVPEQRVAVMRFHGAYNRDRVEAAKAELMRRLAQSELVPLGEPRLAAFDPPWVLPLLRRNELWVEIAPRMAT